MAKQKDIGDGVLLRWTGSQQVYTRCLHGCISGNHAKPKCDSGMEEKDLLPTWHRCASEKDGFWMVTRT